MAGAAGGNARDMKNANRLRVLQLVCTGGPMSRAEVCRRTGLTRMTAANITADLAAAGLLCEQTAARRGAGAGRTPGLLCLADRSPCVAGIFVGRRHCSVLICDLAAVVQTERSWAYEGTLTGERLIEAICALFVQARRDCGRPLAGAGISALGPASAATGTLLAPPNFYGIRDLPLRELLAPRLGLPCALIHDCSAGALAEQLYGSGRGLDNFIYLHIRDGISAGLVAGGELLEGAAGLAGELGHLSIRFDGPLCPCGNRGCLELYANEQTAAADYLRLLGHSGAPVPAQAPAFADLVGAASAGDGIAARALDSFAGYVAAALTSCINLVDAHRVFVGHRGEGDALEQLLESKVNSRLLAADSRHVRVEHSRFGARAPVLGAAALAARQVFTGAWPVLEWEK